MNTKELADLLNIVPNTLRRYSAEYHAYLSPTAHPPKGHTRVYSPHDARVMHYIVAARNVGQPAETIAARLAAMQAGGWSDLPETPPEWDQQSEPLALTYAAHKAYDLAALAVAQKELEITRGALETAQHRVTDLENEIAAVRASETATAAEKQALLLELEQARGRVSTLEARLQSYALTGERPLSLALIILVTALAVAVLVIVLLIVVRLVL